MDLAVGAIAILVHGAFALLFAWLDGDREGRSGSASGRSGRGSSGDGGWGGDGGGGDGGGD